MINFELVKGDIFEQKVDVIVTETNQGLNPIEGAIHKLTGSDLLAECKEIGGCSIGKARLTMSYDLEQRGIGWIIHGAGPRYAGGMYFEADLLADVYRAALDITLDYREFYRKQCLEVLERYVGHLEESAKKPYRKETEEEVVAYCSDYPIRSIAFPSISTGTYGYPLDEAAVIAVRTIKSFCRQYDHLDKVVLVCKDKVTYDAYRKI